MKIYALISQKGGAGKSTIARQLAVFAGGAGPSYLIDRDPQATTTKWWSRRTELSPALDKPELVDLDGATLSDAAAKLRSRPGVAFVDTRPAVEEPERRQPEWRTS